MHTHTYTQILVKQLQGELTNKDGIFLNTYDGKLSFSRGAQPTMTMELHGPEEAKERMARAKVRVYAYMRA
jgi:hypothetical protein